jgi:pimeloyl-ACP methyl ester carboxylesterase
LSQFRIESTEGLPIRGNLEIPERARALVVVAHGFKGFKDWGFFPWLAERLCDFRFGVCRFNMSRSGIGDDPETFGRLDLFEHDSYSTQVDDLVSVARYAQDRAPELPLFLLGHSRGGGVAILAASRLDFVQGIVTWSAISHANRWDDATVRQWRTDGFMDAVNARTGQTMRMSTRIVDDYEENRAQLDILAAARGLTAPLLVVHGERDESVPVSEAQAIHAAAPDATLAIIHNASHTYNAIHPLIHVPQQLSMAAMITARFVGAYA